MNSYKKKYYGLIGYPVGHSMSPLMHNDQFERLQLPYSYQAFEVDPADLGEAVRGLKALNYSGFNVTVPHKVEVMKYLDDIDKEAEIIGAVNTVEINNGHLIGRNTDGTGYLQSLLVKAGPVLTHKKILVIGAGGAARAVVSALINHGAENVILTNRTLGRAELISESLASPEKVKVLPKKEAEKETPSFDIIINTTSIGMHPNVTDTPWTTAELKPGVLCSDLIYNPLYTKWLKDAEQAGAEILNGVGMFVGQGAVAFEIWTGLTPDINRMTRIVLEQLGGDE
ncbi:shikimate dehydrogenase [Alteribacillus sp. HJP-4]|uniref:shikimate dehydrogenase n=1 Tax=Alteribacillus sp. HJP-4 TaxID=2775394 RepID=UPI0035CD2EB0